MPSTLRKTDSKAESIVKEYLICNFYEILFKNKYKSITDASLQQKGKDTIIFDDKKGFAIDEKSAVHYINTPLSTFAFEIQFKNRAGNIVDGWFIDDTLETQYYFVMWIHAKPKYRKNGDEIKGKDYLESFRKTDITLVEMYCINKEILKRYLHEKYHLTNDNMRKKANEMRMKYKESKHQSPLDDKIKYFYSGNLYEQPTNLVINKSVLKDLARSVYLIKPNEIIKNGVVIYETP